jgi:alpha-1,3-rhamnosyltransferase
LQQQHGFYFEPQPNQGLAATLNKAIALSKGQYIAQIGSDDIFTLDKIEKQVRFMESRPDIAICGGNMITIDAHGNAHEKQKQFPYRELNFEDLFAQRKAGIPASSSMIRRDVLDKEGAYAPDIRLEDMYLWFKLLSRGHIMAGLDDTLLYYRKHGSNTYRNYRFMYENMMATYAPYKDHPLYNDVVNRYRLSSALALAKHGDKPLARNILKQIPLRYFSMKLLRGYFHAWRPF